MLMLEGLRRPLTGHLIVLLMVVSVTILTPQWFAGDSGAAGLAMAQPPPEQAGCPPAGEDKWSEQREKYCNCVNESGAIDGTRCGHFKTSR